ncbi:MAG: hypothetical protein PVG99_15540 [Desulfobacteraceae bacterium]
MAQQRTVLVDALKALSEIEIPGAIVDLPYRWKKETYNLEKAA